MHFPEFYFHLEFDYFEVPTSRLQVIDTVLQLIFQVTEASVNYYVSLDIMILPGAIPNVKMADLFSLFHVKSSGEIMQPSLGPLSIPDYSLTSSATTRSIIDIQTLKCSQKCHI